MKCKRCYSYAINPHCHGREAGVDLDLCDVCYWRKRAEASVSVDPAAVFRRHGFRKLGPQHWYATSEAQFNSLGDDPARFAAGITCHGETAEPGRWYAVVL